ncbi:MAG TPA: nucleotidyltransferase domain-containing protein [Rhodocyclaceae bacterium]|nr:nucleotidyltransferase domain-containing protein [Rhodocyclaceae bacterium]
MSSAGRFGLSQATIDKLNGVFSQHESIDVVLIYGSRAKGSYRRGSDIDLTIKGRKIAFLDFMRLENEIDDLMLPYTVDISQYLDITNQDLIAHIDRVGIPIYRRGESAPA